MNQLEALLVLSVSLPSGDPPPEIPSLRFYLVRVPNILERIGIPNVAPGSVRC